MLGLLNQFIIYTDSLTRQSYVTFPMASKSVEINISQRLLLPILLLVCLI